MNGSRRFWRFFSQRFPAVRYLVYVVLWPAGVLGALAPLHPPGTPVGPGAVTQVCAALALFVILFFMRAVDEIKDLDYDREFHPDRPLVTGETDIATVRHYLAWSAVVAVALSAVAGVEFAVTAVLIMAYSLFLLRLERASRRFRESVYGNIVVTIQLKTGLIWYTVELSWSAGTRTPILPTLLLVVAFLLAYLHWETARKTIRAEFALPGEKLYSTAKGAVWSLTLSGALLVIACVLRAAVAIRYGDGGIEQAALLVPLIFLAWNAVNFAKKVRTRYEPGKLALFAYLSFLLVALLQPMMTGDADPWFG